jgi:hypothetical protein
MGLASLTVAEARAIVLVDAPLELSFDARLAAGKTFGIDDLSAWVSLVESAKERLSVWEGRQGLG